MMRFCTSDRFTTSTTSTRCPDNGRNSTWRRVVTWRRGTATSPAIRVSSARVREAWDTSAWGDWSGASMRRSSSRSRALSGRSMVLEASSVST